MERIKARLKNISVNFVTDHLYINKDGWRLDMEGDKIVNAAVDNFNE